MDKKSLESEIAQCASRVFEINIALENIAISELYYDEIAIKKTSNFQDKLDAKKALFFLETQREMLLWEREELKKTVLRNSGQLRFFRKAKNFIPGSTQLEFSGNITKPIR